MIGEDKDKTSTKNKNPTKEKNVDGPPGKRTDDQPSQIKLGHNEKDIKPGHQQKRVTNQRSKEQPFDQWSVSTQQTEAILDSFSLPHQIFTINMSHQQNRNQQQQSQINSRKDRPVSYLKSPSSSAKNTASDSESLSRTKKFNPPSKASKTNENPKIGKKAKIGGRQPQIIDVEKLLTPAPPPEKQKTTKKSKQKSLKKPKEQKPNRTRQNRSMKPQRKTIPIRMETPGSLQTITTTDTSRTDTRSQVIPGRMLEQKSGQPSKESKVASEASRNRSKTSVPKTVNTEPFTAIKKNEETEGGGEEKVVTTTETRCLYISQTTTETITPSCANTARFSETGETMTPISSASMRVTTSSESGSATRASKEPKEVAKQAKTNIMMEKQLPPYVIPTKHELPVSKQNDKHVGKPKAAIIEKKPATTFDPQERTDPTQLQQSYEIIPIADVQEADAAVPEYITVDDGVQGAAGERKSKKRKEKKRQKKKSKKEGDPTNTKPESKSDRSTRRKRRRERKEKAKRDAEEAVTAKARDASKAKTPQKAAVKKEELAGSGPKVATTASAKTPAVVADVAKLQKEVEKSKAIAKEHQKELEDQKKKYDKLKDFVAKKELSKLNEEITQLETAEKDNVDAAAQKAIAKLEGSAGKEVVVAGVDGKVKEEDEESIILGRKVNRAVLYARIMDELIEQSKRKPRSMEWNASLEQLKAAIASNFHLSYQQESQIIRTLFYDFALTNKHCVQLLSKIEDLQVIPAGDATVCYDKLWKIWLKDDSIPVHAHELCDILRTHVKIGRGVFSYKKRRRVV